MDCPPVRLSGQSGKLATSPRLVIPSTWETGTYNGRTEPRNDGTAANPIRFVADTSGAKSRDAGAVILIRSEAFRDDSFKIDRDDFIQIIGFTFYGNTEMISWKDCVGACECMSANGSFRVLDWTEKR
jgi:hypothetical protein